MHDCNLSNIAHDSSGIGKSIFGNFLSFVKCCVFVKYHFDLLQSNYHSVMLLESIVYGVWAVNLVFAVCELGEQLCSNCNGIENEMVQMEWYLFPMKIQKILVPITIYAQKSVEIQFFGSLSCSREQFKRVS